MVRAYRAGDASGALAHARRALERAEGRGALLQVLRKWPSGSPSSPTGSGARPRKPSGARWRLLESAASASELTAWALCFLAEAKLGQGDPRAALELADEALADARQSGGRLFEMDALLTRARALLGSEGASCAAEVERTLAEASALIDETEARCREPIVHEISAELARLRGDEATR